MSALAPAADGVFFDGRNSRAHAVRVWLLGDAIVVRGDGIAHDAPVAAVRVTTRLAGTHRTLVFADGAQVQVGDNDAVDAWFPQRGRLEALIDRLERNAVTVAAAMLVTVAVVAFTVLVALPWAAERVADRIPDSVADRIGADTEALLPHFGFEPTTLDATRVAHYQALFTRYLEGMPSAESYQLVLLHAPGNKGANAFALPGRHIVFTDQLIELFTDDRQFEAVLAHEVGHEVNRHLLRSVLQNSALILIGSLATGDVSSASGVVVAIPTFLLGSHYSRRFESEADDYAFANLALHGISPRYFADAMKLLRTQYAGLEPPAYLSTHPPSLERIQRANEAAENFVPPRTTN